MPFITYNPTSFTTPAYEDARSFAIWGVSWFTETDLSRLGPAAPAVVWMAPQTFNGGVRRSDHTGTTNLPTAVTSYIDKVKQFPKGRRVIMPQYWLDDTLGGNDRANSNYYKTLGQQMAAHGAAGTFINSPFQRLHQSVDFKTTWTKWVELCETNDATFDYIIDDQEQWRLWALNSNQIIADAGWTAPTWMTDKDARVPFSIINDARFENPLYGDPVTNQSMRELLVYYTNIARPSSPIANTLSAVQTAFADWNITVANPGISPYTTNRNPLWYAWRRMMGRVHIRHRVELILKETIQKPWFTGFYSDYGVIGGEPWETPWLIRAQHYAENYLAHPLCRGAPELYGYASNMPTVFGYHPTPTTDIQRYGFVRPADGGVLTNALAGDAGRVMYSFMGDLAEAVETSRANYRRDWSAWVGTPHWAYGPSFYQFDDRYAFELYYHLALLGCNPFCIFPGEGEIPEGENPYVLPSDILVEIKRITDNGGLRPCDSTGNQYAPPDRYVLADCLTDKGIVTGGTIQHGPKKGLNVWRITVPPHIIDGSGNSFINLPDGTKYQVGPTTRGAWYFGQTKPTVTITTS